MGKLLIKGKLYNPIKVGDSGDWYEGKEDSVCGDCKEVYDADENAKEEDIERLIQEQLRQSELE